MYLCFNVIPDAHLEKHIFDSDRDDIEIAPFFSIIINRFSTSLYWHAYLPSFLTYLLTYLLTYIPAYLLIFLLTYLLTYLLIILNYTQYSYLYSCAVAFPRQNP